MRRLLVAIVVLCACAGWQAIAAGQEPLRPDQRASSAAIADTFASQLENQPALQPAPSAAENRPAPVAGLDPSLVAAGEGAFSRSCTTCHDAERALTKSKSYGGWLATIRRMAAKADANVPTGDIEPIAAYLASRSGGAAGGTAATGDGSSAPAMTIYGTVSPWWRGGNDNLENPGFFPDTWVGVSWQTETPISARVTSCITCHTEPGQGHRIELVEAALRYDLSDGLACCFNRDIKAGIEAGRFIVPFGAFAAQSNPGVYRTVTKPLIYDMGQRVHKNEIGDPVLPMPYADEGAAFNVSAPVGAQFATFDGYLVNGLQGSPAGVNFYLSRDYVDNNSQPAAGGRLTFGDQSLRLGSSLMSGQFSPTGGAGPIPQALYYRIWGYDAILRYRDLVKIQFEYARRDSDRVDFNGPPARVRDHVQGYYIQGEFLISYDYNINFLVRYDRQHSASGVPPPGSFLPIGTFGVSRFTYGFNFTLAGGSVLMINHEHWWLPDGLEKTDVLGIRWVATF